MRPVIARGAAKFFSLLDERLDMPSEGYTPRLVEKIEFAGGNQPSFKAASQVLRRLAELTISPKQVERITERLGRERAARRGHEVAAFRSGTLQPTHRQPPAVAAIHMDAGKLQLRGEDDGPGIHHPGWNDMKIACFQTYAPKVDDADPQPDPPVAFLDPPRVMRLCQEMERVRHRPDPGPFQGRPPAEKPVEQEPRPDLERPRRLVRTAVATMAAAAEFGWMVAAEATKRGFYQAARKAVVGDGGNWISPLGDLHFDGWVQVLDFLHLLVHLYAAATAAYRQSAREAWRFYEKTLRWAWAGEVRKVLRALEAEVARLGLPPPKAWGDDPRRVVSRVLEYVRTNAHRMDYAAYRRAGLPISSALVESLVKQFNFRVKGTEKFWIGPGAESILQVRAAYLSEDDRAETFHQHRPRGPAVGQKRFRPAA